MTARDQMRNTVVLLLALITGACQPYSFSGGRTALVETVAVPIFENDTAEFGLAEELTAGIIDGFIEDNQVKVVELSSAEATLNGRVKDYQKKAYTFDENDQVNEYMVEIWVAVALRKKGDTTAVWDAPNMRGFGIYPADSAETVGQTRAIEKITEDVINRTIKSW